MLIVVPPVAIVLNHDVISAVLMIVWTTLIIPLCILHAIDYLRASTFEDHSLILRTLVKVPIALLGLLSFIMGAAIVVWCLYNICVQRLPGYTGPKDVVDLFLGRFGIASILVSFGWYLIQLSIGREQRNFNEKAAENQD
ncbi:MAG TPA: hypothetical protein VF719_08695 [Abditibacteriaceae bacterium]